MKKTLFVMLVSFLAFASYASADLYQWRDEKGVIHITDSIEKVPQKYRAKVKVHESTPPRAVEAPVSESAPPSDIVPPEAPQDRREEIYGDQTLEWWRQTFAKKQEEMRALETSVASKKQFVETFEGGRRFGQTYGQSEMDTYNRYKTELAGEQNRLNALKDEFDELKRKATIAGVPREVRGE